MYDRTTVQGATFNMRGQLYRGHANATALSSSPVVSALGSESDDPGSSPGRGKVFCPWNVQEQNASYAFRLGLIYILVFRSAVLPKMDLNQNDKWELMTSKFLKMSFSSYSSSSGRLKSLLLTTRRLKFQNATEIADLSDLSGNLIT